MTNKQELSDLGSNIGFLGGLQRFGNKLPEPFMLFLWFAIITLIVSFVFGEMGTSVTYTAAGADGTLKEVTVVARNLLSLEFFHILLKDFTNIYITFLPLGMTIVFVMGIGYMQDLGFFDAFMKRCLCNIPPAMVTFVIALLGVNSNLASTGGAVMVTTLGAAVYASIGRNPMLGGVVGYVSFHGGLAANLVVSGEDVLAATVTQAVCNSMGINAPVNPLMNYYFFFTNTLLLSGIITFTTEVIMPRYVKIEGDGRFFNTKEQLSVTDSERSGLKGAAVATLIYCAFILAGIIPKNGFLRNPVTHTIIPDSPFLSGIIAIIFFLFIFAGTGYGIACGVLKSGSQVRGLMSRGVRDSVSYIVVCLPASFFIYFFGQSKLATIIAVNGANLLLSINFTGIPLIVCFVFFCAFLNLFMTSHSAKWMILGPIFIPMFAAVGMSPALTQVAYRIADSSTNPITPINYFLPMVIAILDQYRDKEKYPEIKLGHVISMTFPYSVAIFLTMITALIIWIIFDLPLGPGCGLYL